MPGRAKVLLTIAGLALATPVAAQAPGPATAFDGTYAGVSLKLEGTMMGDTPRSCLQNGKPTRLSIANGIARTRWAGTAEGSVSPQGVLVMRAPNGARFDGQIDGKGTVTGRLNGGCSYQMIWQKLSASTTAFDGEYTGVSRESSKTASAPGADCPPNGVPAPLTITKGVVLSDKASWEGAVSPQGVLVMRSGRFGRVDGQIDPDGTIKGQYGDSACSVTFVWRKQSG
jgi:hypothetical protein